MIKAIFAVDVWGGMGYNGSLPWPHHREDFQYFKEQTTDHIVVMGRRTWDDPKMPKPLPNRICYVATNRPVDKAIRITGEMVEEVKKLERYYPDKTIWIIGGPDLIMSCKEIIDEVHVTHFKGQYRSDTKMDLRKLLNTFRATGAWTSTDKKCTWTIYKNVDIFRNMYV